MWKPDREMVDNVRTRNNVTSQGQIFWIKFYDSDYINMPTTDMWIKIQLFLDVLNLLDD